MDNVTRQVRIAIYRLKRNYGFPISYYRLATATYDAKTGRSVKSNTLYSIDRAVVLPKGSEDEFVYDLSFIAANKNFTYGGTFQDDMRVFVIDGEDLDITPNTRDTIQYDGLRYDISKIWRAAQDRAYILVGNAIIGTPVL